MIPPFNALEFGIVVAMFAVVTVLGFMATRWKRATSLASIEEWGLGGRRFGTWVTWFLIGGDLYTAYTFVAVPALLFGTGATGFFAVPYTIAVFPLVMFAAARMWSVCHEHGYATVAEFVRGRQGSTVGHAQQDGRALRQRVVRVQDLGIRHQDDDLDRHRRPDRGHGAHPGVRAASARAGRDEFCGL